jgi:hypothetical protein
MSTTKKTSLKKRSSFTFKPDWSNVQLSADLEYDHAKRWKKAVRRYEKNPKDFFNSYTFLVLHPANVRRFDLDTLAGTPESWFMENLYIMVVKVDPKTKRIETIHNPNWKKDGRARDLFDKKRNTETNVWVEWGPYMEAEEFSTGDFAPTTGSSSHDPRTDTGGATFEEAIINLANNVYHLYGGHRRISDAKKLPKRLRK